MGDYKLQAKNHNKFNHFLPSFITCMCLLITYYDSSLPNW